LQLATAAGGIQMAVGGKKCPAFGNFVLEIVIDPGARFLNNAGSVEHNKLI